MRFTTLAMIASAMLTTIQAAPLSARHYGDDSSVSINGSGIATGDSNTTGGVDTKKQGDSSLSGHGGIDGSSQAWEPYHSVGVKGDGNGSQQADSSSSSADASGSQADVGSQLDQGSGIKSDVSGKADQGSGADMTPGQESDAEVSTGQPGKSNSASGNASGLELGLGSNESGGSGKTKQNSGTSGDKSGSGSDLLGGLGLGLDGGSSKSSGGSGSGSSSSLLSSLLPSLTDVTSVLDLNNVLSVLQGLPGNLQSQLLGAVNQPTELTKLIGSLPSNLQSSQLTGLPSKIQQLPTKLPTQLASLPDLVTSLPANLQTIVSDLPAVLQAKVTALPSLIQTLPEQIDGLTSASLQSKLQGLPDLLTTALNTCQFGDVLKTLDSLLGGGSGKGGNTKGSTGGVIGLPVQLEQALTIVETTLTQIMASSSSGSKAKSTGNSGTVTTLTGSVTSVDSITIVVVSELKAVTGIKVSSLQDVVSVPAKFCNNQASGSKKNKNGDIQISVDALLTVTGVKVSALTDKVALPLGLADFLKSL